MHAIVCILLFWLFAPLCIVILGFIISPWWGIGALALAIPAVVLLIMKKTKIAGCLWAICAIIATVLFFMTHNM